MYDWKALKSADDNAYGTVPQSLIYQYMRIQVCIYLYTPNRVQQNTLATCTFLRNLL
jgi:hypothetical protein